MSARTSRVEPEIELEATGAAEDAAAGPAAAAAVKSKGNSVDPPLLQQCLRSGCIQEKKSELSTSIYLISLLRVVSLLKAPRPAEIGRTGPRGFYYTLVQEGGGESAAARRIRYLAAAGWIILFVIAAACQFLLFVLVLETSTSSTCDVKSQTGCRSGEYCSFSIAKGQCNDCSAILPGTSTCCPTLNTTCPINMTIGYTDPNHPYTTNATTAPENDLCWDPDENGNDGGCLYVCLMYNHCLNQEEFHEQLPQRCDFLVDARGGVKWSHILLLVFGAVLWTRDLINVLDETDLMAATVPKATGEARKTHNVIVPPLPLEPHTPVPNAPCVCAHARSAAEGRAHTACALGCRRCCCSVSCSH